MAVLVIEAVDHVAGLLDRRVAHDLDKPRIEALLTFDGEAWNEIEAAAMEVVRLRQISEAYGVTLEQIGAILVRPRRGAVDARYRIILSAQQHVLKSAGRPEEFLTLFRLLEGEDVDVIWLHAGVMERIVRTREPGETPVDLATELVLKMAGAGARILWEYQTVENDELFTLIEEDDTGSPAQGFSEVDDTDPDGGTWADVISNDDLGALP